MTWLALLGIAVVIAVFAAVTGAKPKGTRHVAGTKLMGVGRIALVVIAIIIAWIAFQSRG